MVWKKVACKPVFLDKKSPRKLLLDAVQTIQEQGKLLSTNDEHLTTFLRIASEELSRPSVLLSVHIALAATDQE